MKTNRPAFPRSLRSTALPVAWTGLLTLACVGEAQQLAPYVSFTADEVTYEVPVDQGEKGWTIPRVTYGDENLGWMVTLDGTLNPDPAIAYGIAVVDFGAPSVFGFAFGTPIVSVSSPNTVNASISGGLTDFTGDGFALTPPGLTVQASEVGLPLTGMGVDVGPAFLAAPGPAGAVHVYGPHMAGPIAGPGPGPWSFLTVSASFGLLGGGDVAALTGYAEITEIPEVNGGVLAGGLALILGLALRRTRKGGSPTH